MILECERHISLLKFSKFRPRILDFQKSKLCLNENSRPFWINGKYMVRNHSTVNLLEKASTFRILHCWHLYFSRPTLFYDI